MPPPKKQSGDFPHTRTCTCTSKYIGQELMKPCGRNAVCESLSEIFALLLTYYFIIKGILRPPNYTLKDKLEKARKASQRAGDRNCVNNQN